MTRSILEEYSPENCSLGWATPSSCLRPFARVLRDENFSTIGARQVQTANTQSRSDNDTLPTRKGSLRATAGVAFQVRRNFRKLPLISILSRNHPIADIAIYGGCHLAWLTLDLAYLAHCWPMGTLLACLRVLRDTRYVVARKSAAAVCFAPILLYKLRDFFFQARCRITGPLWGIRRLLPRPVS